jgi:hypothetical protein
MATTARKPRTTRPAPAPIVLTPEQIEAATAREKRYSAHQAAREDLINRAHALAEKLHPGRVTRWPGHAREDFSVMFGDPNVRCFGYSGGGIVEMCVELVTWSRVPGSDEFAPPALRFRPRSYSLDADDGIDGCEAQGRALVEAAAFARALLALTRGE